MAASTIVVLFLAGGCVLLFLAYTYFGFVAIDLDGFMKPRLLFCPIHQSNATVRLIKYQGEMTDGMQTKVKECSLLKPEESCEAGCLKERSTPADLMRNHKPGIPLSFDRDSARNNYIDVID